MGEKTKLSTRLKAMLGGIVLCVGGVGLLAGFILSPEFLLDFLSNGGVLSVFSPFGLILIGVALILYSRDSGGRKRKRERKS